MRRWVCPECGAGKHAPERLRRNDVRRFCLECSGNKAKGPLVERVCPAVERRREAKATAKAAAAAKRAESRAAAREKRKADAAAALPLTGDPKFIAQMVRGVDLASEYLWLRKFAPGWREGWLRPLSLAFSREPIQSRWLWDGRSCRVNASGRLGQTVVDLVHLLCTRDLSIGHHRGRNFRDTMGMVASEAYNIPGYAVSALHEREDSLWPFHSGLGRL